MKRDNLLSFALMIVFFTVCLTVSASDDGTITLKGNSNTKVGEYQIKELPAETINGETLRKFELVYENAKNPVLIYLSERTNCRDYIVRSKNMEIKYVCKKNGFGAQLLTGKFVKYDPTVNSYFIMNDELVNQSKISEGGLTIDEALGLIASYYPALLKSTDLL
jgi:hypothetical protein